MAMCRLVVRALLVTHRRSFRLVVPLKGGYLMAMLSKHARVVTVVFRVTGGRVRICSVVASDVTSSLMISAKQHISTKLF